MDLKQYIRKIAALLTEPLFITWFRIVSAIVWTASILYATYHVWLACDEYLYWYSDASINPGPFSNLLSRGKDSTDFEWEAFSCLFYWRLCLWYTIFTIMSCVVPLWISLQAWNRISIIVTVVMFCELLGFLPTLFILCQPIFYWAFLQTRSQVLAWIATFLFIYNLNRPFSEVFIPKNKTSEYFFVVTSAWNCARCISFCFDVWSDVDYKKHGMQLQKLLNVISKDITHLKDRKWKEVLFYLLQRLLRIGSNALLIELILHILYFRALSQTTVVHRDLSLWAVCGTIYWLGWFNLGYQSDVIVCLI